KLNLLAVSQTARLIFIAESHVLAVYSLDNPSHQIAFIGLDNNDSTINQIRLGLIDGEECLITVDDDGFIRLFFVNDLDRQPLRYFNSSSTWGIAMCPTKPLFAVSANSHNITIWDMSRGDQCHYYRRTLQGHRHNIPCIDFSSCGNFLVSISVDNCIRIWDVNSQQTITMMHLSQWGWGCRWMELFQDDHTHTTTRTDTTTWIGMTHEQEQQEVQQAAAEEQQQPQQQQQLVVHNDNDMEEEQEVDEDPNADLDDDNVDEDDAVEEEEFEDEDEEMAYILEQQRILIEEVKAMQSEGQVRFKLVNAAVAPKDKPPSHLVFTTFQNLYFSDAKLTEAININNPSPTTFPIAQTQLERVAMLEVIPELSLCVCASQGPTRQVAIFKVKSIDKGKLWKNFDNFYRRKDDSKELKLGFSIEQDMIVLLPAGEPSIVVGMTLCRNQSPTSPSLFSVSLYVLYINGVLCCYNIRKRDSQLDILSYQ
ncbi:hypothetical protein SAMD00019534_080230, partial [Acytostelium subglobosum LB1]|uniref:hypothetical protein n=1 Tax=Acytostelium subglobosum LB1 TaxID=1410327 RepID=UPI000644E290